ncbi:MAG: C10 family peptidase, partial [Lentisphaeria bacterium]|nr:C10 family peptidase [Lentisphaeria bacterium]
MKNLFPAVFTIFLWLSALTLAAPLSEQSLLAAASAWLGQNAIFRQRLPEVSIEGITPPGGTSGLANLAVVHLSPRGYLIMGGDDLLPPVIAFSETTIWAPGTTSGTAPNATLADLLRAQDGRLSAILGRPQTRYSEDYFSRNRRQWDRLRPAAATRANPIEDPPPASTILQPPLLATLWGQHAPYDHYLPTSGNSTLIRADAGCVPVAIAQILKFHHWPRRGQGSRSHTDSEGTTRATLAANLTLPFAWDAMQDAYAGAGGAPTALTNLSVGRVCLALSVFFESDYETDGTGTFSNDIPQVFADHLFFQSSGFKMSNISPHYSNYISQAALYANIRTDILAGRPAYVGFSDMDYIGNHSFVADGL